MAAEAAEMSEQEVVVVLDTRVLSGRPGSYALVRAAEWCAMSDEVTIWRGPNHRDEIVPERFLEEVSCKSLNVDGSGYFICVPTDEPIHYPCTEIHDDLRKTVIDQSEEILNEYAARQQAEAQSYVDHEIVSDTLGNDWSRFIWAVAEVDDAIAVNGEVTQTKKQAKPPKGWLRTDKGGRFDAGEAEIEKDWLAEPIADAVSRKLKERIHPRIVRRILDHEYPKQHIMWNAGYGNAQVWVSKSAMKRIEKIEEEAALKKWERESSTAAQRANIEKLARERALREHQEKVRRGGYPDPRDWSPRGKLPGE